MVEGGEEVDCEACQCKCGGGCGCECWLLQV